MFEDLVKRNRSYRRFDQSKRVQESALREIVSLVRLIPSARNQQALKFRIVHDESTCDTVYEHLAWAGYLRDWIGPREGERPTGYVIIMGDRDLGSDFTTDLGIAAQTIMLAAVEKGMGGCMVASVKKASLSSKLQLPERCEILLVLALGYPVEDVVVEEMQDGDVKYWRDEEEKHHVPKRAVDDLII